MTLQAAKWLFLLLVFSLPLVRPLNTRIFGLLVPSTDFIFIAAGGFWLIGLLRRETRLRASRFYLFLALYGAALTISTIWSIHPVTSFYKLLGEFYLFALAILTFNLAAERAFFRRVVVAWLAGTAITVLAALAGFGLFYLGFQSQADNYFLSHYGSLPAGNYPRLHALFANANMMCNFLTVSLMMALLAERCGWLKRLWAVILQAGIWFAAIFTFSAGVGGMLLSWSLWRSIRFREKQPTFLARAVLAGGLLAAALVLASVLVSPDTRNPVPEFKLPLTGDKVEVSVRVLTWQSALETFLENPLIGKGTGANAAFVQYETLSGTPQILLDAHNMWLNVLGQTGVIGFFAFLALVVYLASRCRLLSRADAGGSALPALSLAFLGAFLFQGLFGSFEDARHLWVLFGLIVAQADAGGDRGRGR